MKINSLRLILWTIFGFLCGLVVNISYLGKEHILPFATTFDYTIQYYNLKYSGTSGNFVDNSVLIYGAYEKPEINFLIDLAKKLNNETSVLIDVGANTGLHSLALSKYFKTIHAIEPFPPILKRLHFNIKQNNLNNIFVHEVGLGKENGTLTFFPPPTNNTAVGTFSKDFANKWNETNHTIKIEKPLNLPIITGDEFLSKNSIKKIDVIKIDIEGYEKFALLGLKDSLKTCRPFIVMELNINNGEGFSDFNELMSVLPDNYKILDFLNTTEDLYTGNYKLKNLKTNNTSQRNIVLVPIEKENLVPLNSKTL